MAGLYAILDTQHREILDDAIRNVLGTHLALETCAQIADGLPLARVAYDQYYRSKRDDDHPISAHTSLCPGAEEAARDFLSGFAIGMLDFDVKVSRLYYLVRLPCSLVTSMPRQLLRAYQSAAPGHPSFYCRLIELVAVAVHKTAILLFKQRHRIHDRYSWNAALTIKRVTSYQSKRDKKRRVPRPSTLFAHLSYDAADQYPNGVADVVGYWAENRILGGVVIFDRSKTWDDKHAVTPEPNVYLHSDRDGVTIRVWQALDEQQQALIAFLLPSPFAPCPCPFPLTATKKNLERFDPEDATPNKVYRDIWERKPPPYQGRGRGVRGVGGCCPNVSLDYPERELGNLFRVPMDRLDSQPWTEWKGGIPENSLLQYLRGNR
jgi:hypothetical protein